MRITLDPKPLHADHLERLTPSFGRRLCFNCWELSRRPPFGRKPERKPILIIEAFFYHTLTCQNLLFCGFLL